MQVCTSLQTNNHASTSPLSFLQAGCPSCCPTNSVKALKAQFKRSDLSKEIQFTDAIHVKSHTSLILSVSPNPQRKDVSPSLMLIPSVCSCKVLKCYTTVTVCMRASYSKLWLMPLVL